MKPISLVESVYVLPAPRSRILVKKLILAQLVKKFPIIYGVQSSLLCSQELVTGLSWARREQFTSSQRIFHFFVLSLF